MRAHHGFSFSVSKDTMDNFPPNSKVSKGVPREPVERVTTGEVRRRKPTLGRKFSQTFIGGDAKTAWEYMLWEVAIPEIRTLMVDTLQSGISKLFTGEDDRRRGVRTNPLGYINYANRFRGAVQDDRPPMPTRRRLSKEARARFDFDEIILENRQDIEEVRDRMYDMLSQYDVVTVADLYGLVGIAPEHTDTTWGWTSLKGTEVGRVRGLGYLLDLPEPEHLGR